VLNNAEYTLKKTIRGVEVVEELVTEMNDIDEITREGVQQITALNKEAQQITEIVTIIEDITANTKLIAFNATVEAARAGESGKGFSVVANEIRNLADSVGVATSNIRKIIQGMQDATTQSAEIEAREKEKVEHVLQSVQRTKDHLDMVLRMLDDTVNHARDISLATEEQKVSNDRIFEKMQEFFEIAQFAKVRSADTSASARELDRLAEELQATVEQFKLD
jgi:methyl-accepting chemotaxis protein